MLSTIIYRSHISDHLSEDELVPMIEIANKRNLDFEVTGILLFNGQYFMQLLEGPEDKVAAIYKSIIVDIRHHNLVELLRDYSPDRRFGNLGMEIFDLRKYPRETVLQAVLDRGTSKYQLNYDDRALQFISAFVNDEALDHLIIPSSENWIFVLDPQSCREYDFRALNDAKYNFAFQPIVDPVSRHITSYEAKLRTTEGFSPLKYFSSLSKQAIYQLDIESKNLAFRMAKQMGIQDKTLIIKLLPMSLVMVKDAVSKLLQSITDNGLIPEQIVVAVSEDGVINDEQSFTDAVQKLKKSGIRLAIDDFGAGSAGLLLLTRMQPDQIMIDRNLLNNIHKSGPKQAVVQAIMKFCSSLKISIIAAGIENPQDWMWLYAAGIHNFQGSLFSAPSLSRLAAIAWPQKRDSAEDNSY